MRTDGQTIKGNEMVIPHVDLEAVREWVKRTFSEDNVTKAGLGSAATVSICYWVAVTYQALQAF